MHSFGGCSNSEGATGFRPCRLRKLRGSVDMKRLKQRTTVAASKITSDPLTCVILKAALKKKQLSVSGI